MHVPSSSLERTIRVAFAHRIFFTRSVFSPGNPLLAEILAANGARAQAKALVVADEGVIRAFPGLLDDITSYLARESCPATLVRPPLVAAGGEAVKNSRDLVEQLYAEIERHGIDRLRCGYGASRGAAHPPAHDQPQPGRRRRGREERHQRVREKELPRHLRAAVRGD